jgi:hypothetical protein
MPVTASVEIDAPPEDVWASLLAFDSYPEWNPLLRRVDGGAEVGRTIRAIVDQPGVPPLPLRARIVTVAPERELAWETRLPSGFVTVLHRFQLEPLADGTRTRFTQVEELDGRLGREVPDRLVGFLAGGFDEMNDALKQRVEQRRDRNTSPEQTKNTHDHNR